MSNRIDIGHGLVLNFTRKAGETAPSDVWIQFWGSDGKSAAISIAAQIERTGNVIGAGLQSWASDRIVQHMAAIIAAEDAEREKSDNGQFGVGA